jgi:hypothetical protein
MALFPGTELINNFWQATAFIAVACSMKNRWQGQTVAKPTCLRIEKNLRYESKVAAE